MDTTGPVSLTACLNAFRLLATVALGDTGQSAKCANFLLAWWNAGDNGGFDLTDMWSVDNNLRDCMVVVFTFVAHNRYYADKLDHAETMQQIWQQWRGRTKRLKKERTATHAHS